MHYHRCNKFVISEYSSGFHEVLDTNVPEITNDVNFLLNTELIDVVVEFTFYISIELETIQKSFKKNYISKR